MSDVELKKGDLVFIRHRGGTSLAKVVVVGMLLGDTPLPPPDSPPVVCVRRWVAASARWQKGTDWVERAGCSAAPETDPAVIEFREVQARRART